MTKDRSQLRLPHIKNITHWSNLSLAGKLTIIITFLLLITSYPYVINRMFNLPSDQAISMLCLIALGMVSIIFKKHIKVPTAIHLLIMIQIVGWFTFFLYHSDTSYIVRIFFLLLTYFVIGTLNSTKSLITFVEYNNVIITTQAALAAIGFILVFIGILNTVATYSNIDNRALEFFFITCSNTHIGNFIRPSGFFDEPGALAAWGIFALLFNKLYFRNTRIECVLLVGLLFTFSAAYFIQVFFYLIFFYSNNKRNFVILILFGLICLTAFQFLSESDEFMRMTIDRFSGGEIRSERTELAEIAKTYFYSSPIMGIGAKNMDSIGYMADNQFETLAKDGIIGTILTYLPYIYLCFRYKFNKPLLLSIFILLLGYLQRPFHINSIHFLMMYLFIAMAIYFNYGKSPKSFDNNGMLQCKS